MDAHEHVLRLGKLLGNLQSLELSLRGELARRPGAAQVHAEPGVDVLALPLGAEVPESNITDYASLRQLLDLFNTEARARGAPVVDLHVVELRDALAHGRVYSKTQAYPLTLVKFDKPKGGRARVMYRALMDEGWFGQQMKMLVDAMQIIIPGFEP